VYDTYEYLRSHNNIRVSYEEPVSLREAALKIYELAGCKTMKQVEDKTRVHGEPKNEEQVNRLLSSELCVGEQTLQVFGFDTPPPKTYSARVRDLNLERAEPRKPLEQRFPSKA
jgi:hypothetical protein